MSIAKVKTAQGAVKWEVRLKPRGRGSKEIRRRFDKKRDAEDFEDEIRSQTKELDRTGFSGDVMEQRVFSEEADYWLLANQYKFSASHKKRVEGVLKEILPKFGRYCLKRFNPGLLVDFQHQQMKLGKSPSTVNRKTEVITSVMNFSFKHRRIPYNPTVGFTKLKQKPAEMGFWEKDEAIDFLGCMDELHPKGSATRWRYVVYLLALNTAMRAGEIWGLMPQDFSKDGHSIYVTRQYNRVTKSFGLTKGKNNRHVPCNQTLKAELLELIERDDVKMDEPVFKSKDGTAKNHDSFGKIRFHDLRHTATTLMLAEGADIKTVKEVCGHRDIVTTMNYVHLLGESVLNLSKTFDLSPKNGADKAKEVS
jgi:integrase